MDIELISRWLGAIAFLTSSASLVWNWISSPGRMVASAVEKINEALKSHDRRIQTVEAEIKHLPSSDDFTQMQLTVTKVESDLRHMDHTLGTVAKTVGRIDDYLRENR